jgi:hypothetical protein
VEIATKEARGRRSPKVPMLGTSKGLEKLTKNKSVEYVMQWRETKVLTPK